MPRSYDLLNKSKKNGRRLSEEIKRRKGRLFNGFSSKYGLDWGFIVNGEGR